MNQKKTVFTVASAITVGLVALYSWLPRSNNDLNSSSSNASVAANLANAVALNESKPAQIAMPPGLEPALRDVANAQAASMQTNAAYQALDSQLKENIALPTWFYTDRDLYAEVARMDSNATVGEVKCGDSLCRIVVQHQTAADRERFAKRGSQAREELSEALRAGANPAVSARIKEVRDVANASAQKASMLSATTIYRFPKENPAETIVYVMKMESRAEISDKVAGMLQRSP